MSESKKVCIALTEADHQKLKELAKREHRSVSNLIRVWIDEHQEKSAG